MANSGIVWDASSLTVALDQITPRVNHAIKAALNYHASRAVAFARQNAPWTDRTANARNGLHAIVNSSGNSHQLIVSHGVPYGIWLEVKWSGRYAILPRTIDHEGPLVLRTANTLIARVLNS